MLLIIYFTLSYFLPNYLNLAYSIMLLNKINHLNEIIASSNMLLNKKYSLNEFIVYSNMLLNKKFYNFTLFLAN